jgi:hypothetical protein
MALIKIIFSPILFSSITIFSLEVTDKIKFRRIILSKYPTVAFRIKSAFYGSYPLWKERILRRMISDNLKFSNCYASFCFLESIILSLLHWDFYVLLAFMSSNAFIHLRLTSFFLPLVLLLAIRSCFFIRLSYMDFF